MTIIDWLGEENKIGVDIWEKKYRQDGESFDEWLDRVSDGNQDYRQLMIEKKFLPGGRILANRGLYKKGVKVTYSNCYVIPAPEDSIESIFDCAKQMARTFSYGGGVGIDISKLAPRGAKVNNTAKQTSGSVSFMDLYSMVTGLIGQNGRRGALMISIACDHPDVEEFIELKSDLDKVTKANISVRVTKDFMDAVINNGDFKLTFTRAESGEVIEKTVKASELFDKLCYMNWDYAEPGILFWDKIESWNLLSNNSEFSYGGVNPCAEEPLPEGGSCCLGSINLAAFVNEDKTFNYEDFKKAVRLSVRFLNDILDEGLLLHPLLIQRQCVGDWRQIGCGIMGLADALIKMELTYGSFQAIQICDEIGHTMIETAIDESASIAKEKGAYPKYDERVLDSPFFAANVKDSKVIENVRKHGLRNSQLLTCAPTGTLSTLLEISGGIEPIFANFYTRKTESLHGEDRYYKIYTPIVKRYMEEHNIEDDADLPDWFITSPEIQPLNRIAMQSTWQKYIDASISSTINLPNEATQDEVRNIYIQAYQHGLKGITIYRSGCKREGILVATPTKEEEKPAEPITLSSYNLEPNLPWGTVLGVDDDLLGMKRKIINGCGAFHLQAFYDELEGRIWETFLSLGDGGGCERNLEFISKLMSKCLRAGVPIEEIIETAKSSRPCMSYCNRSRIKGDTSPGISCPSAIGKALEDFNNKIKSMYNAEEVEELEPEEDFEETEENTFEEATGLICPECGEPLIHEGGCDVCRSCGYSHCG